MSVGLRKEMKDARNASISYFDARLKFTHKYKYFLQNRVKVGLRKEMKDARNAFISHFYTLNFKLKLNLFINISSSAKQGEMKDAQV